MFKLSAMSRIGRRRTHPTNCKSSRQRFGTATVEMAFVAPVIFLLVFGSIEFARMMMVRQALTNAARDGCRTACLATTQSDALAKTKIRESLRGVIEDAASTEALRITIDPPFTDSPASGTSLTALVEIDCEDVSWLPPFLTKGARIRCSSKMNRE